MNLTELSIITGEAYKIEEDKGVFMLDFRNLAEVKDGGCLKSVFARGDTLEEAKQRLVENLRDETLVFDAMGSNRKEYKIPTTLVV